MLCGFSSWNCICQELLLGRGDPRVAPQYESLQAQAQAHDCIHQQQLACIISHDVLIHCSYTIAWLFNITISHL